MFKNFIWNGRKFKADDQGTVLTEFSEALEIDENEQLKTVLIHFPYDEYSETGVYFEGKKIDCESDHKQPRLTLNKNCEKIFLDRLIAHMFCKNEFPDILTKVNHIANKWQDCSAQKLYWSPIGNALTEPERNFKKLDILGHLTHFFIYCPEENCIFANPKHAAFMFSPETDAERQQIQTKITKCANGNIEFCEYKHYIWCIVVFVKSKEYSTEKIYNTYTGHLAIICRCQKITFLDEKFFEESDLPYIKKALKTDYVRIWDSSRWSRYSDYGEFVTDGEMKKLTKEFYDKKKKSRKSESRKTKTKSTKSTKTTKTTTRSRRTTEQIVDALKPEILIRLSKWIELKSTIDCLPPDKKDTLEKILSDRKCDKNCKDQQSDICLEDSGDEESCPFNLIRKILKTEITERSAFVLSTDQTVYFQIKDLLNKL